MDGRDLIAILTLVGMDLLLGNGQHHRPHLDCDKTIDVDGAATVQV